MSPIFKQSGTDNKQKILQDEDEIDSLIRRLEPLIEEREREREDDAVRENAEEDTTNNAVESAALEGQKSIVQVDRILDLVRKNKYSSSCYQTTFRNFALARFILYTWESYGFKIN